MKIDEPSSSSVPVGDISPIAGTVSNLPDPLKTDVKAPESKRVSRKSEPSSEKLPNFSRVTRAQLAHITFDVDGRYQPVRPVSGRPLKSSKGKSSIGKPPSSNLGITTERNPGGGGILILIDQTPFEPAEFIESEVPAQPPTAPELAVPGAPQAAPATVASGPHIALDEDAPEADPPESFQVSIPLTLIAYLRYTDRHYPVFV